MAQQDQPKTRLGEVEFTPRGLELVKFTDHYGVPCSLQTSSGSPGVWLGPTDPQPKVLHGDAASVGVKTDKTCGWVPYPLPACVDVTTRALLDRNQVAALIEHLQCWLDTGSFTR